MFSHRGNNIKWPDVCFLPKLDLSNGPVPSCLQVNIAAEAIIKVIIALED